MSKTDHLAELRGIPADVPLEERLDRVARVVWATIDDPHGEAQQLASELMEQWVGERRLLISEALERTKPAR